MFIEMRAILFFLTFAVFVATVVWRVDQVMFGDKLAWAEAQSRAQMSSLAHALDAEIQNLRNLLLMSYSEVELSKKEFSAQRPYGRFQMMAKLLPPNTRDDKRDWQIVSQFFQDGASVKSWAPSYVSLVLKTIKENSVRPGSANIYSLMDPQRRPYLLILVRGTGNWYAGLLKTEVFQSLMDRQKGQKSTVFVVNLQGQTLGHTTQEYVGSLLTEDPLVSELMKSSVGSGFGIFKDLKGEPVQGLYEQVENTNLYAVITTPVSSLAAHRGSVRLQLILMGFGLGLIGLALFVFYDRGGPKAVLKSPSPLVVPAAPAPVSFSSGSVPAGNEKMKAYTQVASSLSHELRSPLTAILGHAQLAKNQMTGSGNEHLEKIETEARAAREIVQKLLIFAGEDKYSHRKMGLETVVNKALKHVEGKLISKGIKLTKNIQTVPQFTMAGDLLVKAVENVLLNSIEAMERAPKKELTVNLESNGSTILLSITDTGEGISAQDLPKIFDPFFTTRSGAHHVGLGLSTAMGIFKEAFGEIQVDSERTKGTTVKIEFNPQEGILSQTGEVPQSAVPKPLPKVQESGLIDKTDSETLPPPPVPGSMDPLLVDTTIERMIEDDLPDMPPPPKEIVAAAEPLPPPPTPAPVAPPPLANKPAFSSKIDKPKIEIKKKSSGLDEVQVSVRRPGERL